MEQFETYEWTNTWFECQGDTRKKRAILIGDSIMVGTRPCLKELLGEEWNLDLAATSRSIASPLYQKELELYLGYCSHDFIFYNFGLHAQHLTAEEYEQEYDQMLGKIRKDHPKAQLVVGLSTPVTKQNDQGEYDEFNEKVQERNEIVRRLASKHSVEVVDNYALVDGKKEWKRPDGLHYEEAGYRAIAENIRSFIKK